MNNTKTTEPERPWPSGYDVPVRDVAKVMLTGLRSAGVKADFAKVWRGKYPTTLDLLIEMDCPCGLPSRDGMTFARTRLRVDPLSGALKVQRDEDRGNDCPRCDQYAIDRWLVTCRGHAENGHPDHEPGWISVEDFPDDMSNADIARIMGTGDEVITDDSPMGHIFAAMEKAHFEAKARWDLTHPDEVVEQLRETFGVDHEEFVQRTASERIERAKSLLSTGTKMVGSTEVEVEDWTEASAAQWLVEHDVPATATYREAWALAKEIGGHPPKALVEAGHRLRKDKE